jgi:predicted nucleic acid-binding protein
MQPVIIADASLLQKLYGKILITQIIADEFGLSLPDWIVVQNPADASRQQILELSVDRGEASAIALAVEQKDSLLIMDDLPGRKLARQLKLNVTGTLGVIAEAKLHGVVPLVKPILD